MYNTSNPAEIYNGTTWELLPDNKFLKTGSTPLQQAGSNPISILKSNLPAEKLQVESFSLTRGSMNITGKYSFYSQRGGQYSGAFYPDAYKNPSANGGYNEGNHSGLGLDASRSWTGSTSSATPYTNNMGNGTPISINPEHITVKAWKRLS